MSESLAEGPIDATASATPTEPVVESGGDSGGNPVWGKVYEDLWEVLPEGFQEPVKSRLDKHFSEWDKNYQSGVQKVQSEFEPWKPIVEAGISPAQAQAAMQLYALAEQRPEVLYEQLAAFHKFGQYADQGQAKQEDEEFDLSEVDDSKFDLEKDPRFQAVAQQTQQINQYIQAEANRQAAAEAEAALDSDIKALGEKYGADLIQNPQAMNYILTQTHLLGMQNPNVDPTKFLDQAAQQYTELINQARSAPRASDSAPIVMSSGGVPTSTKNPADLSDQERRGLMTQMLQKLNEG